MKFRNVVAIASTLTVLTSGLTILEAFHFPTPATAQQRIIARFGDQDRESSGGSVRRIQLALVQLRLFREDQVTGRYFGITRDAVAEFQRVNGLPINGDIVDENTANLLFSRAGSSQDRRCSPPNSNELCPYVVMIPASHDNFDRIKQELLRGGHLRPGEDIQLSRENHPRGPIIRLGAYNSRGAAEDFARQVRGYSPDIRVEHLPRIF